MTSTQYRTDGDINGKVIPVLDYVIKHYAIQTYGGMEVELHHS
jgi:hypothetical protein